jgi:uncharacterized protein (DUF433 family)
MSTTLEIGTGSYALADAARIAHVYPRAARRWAEGYEYRYQGMRLRSSPILQSSVPTIEGETFLDFQQLVEVIFIGLFRRHGVSMPVIRAVARTAAGRYKTAHPFAIANLETDGNTIFADSVEVSRSVETPQHERMSSHKITEDLLRGQTVIRQFAEPYFKKIEYNGFGAESYWPLGKDGRIVLNPLRSFGSPIDSASGVPTKALYGMYLAGEEPSAIADWYEVEREAINAAIEFETSLRLPA